jgi:hypothetical protein
MPLGTLRFAFLLPDFFAGCRAILLVLNIV